MSTSTAAPVRKTKRDWGSLFSTVGIVLIVLAGKKQRLITQQAMMAAIR